MKVGDAKKRLLKSALAYPDACKDHPWGETVVKVGKKIFVFFGLPHGGLHVTCKLPHSFEAALSSLSFAEATGYGLGASGWVTATFEGKDEVPVPLLLDWIEESYRAVAPAKLVKMRARSIGNSSQDGPHRVNSRRPAKVRRSRAVPAAERRPRRRN